MAKRAANPWDRGGRNSGGKRAVGTRDLKRRILVICEGTATEPNYFKVCKTHFRATLRELKVRGLGKAPSTLVHKAKGIRLQEEAKTGGVFDEVWCVFDRDDFGANFDQAIRDAGNEGFEVAYSNPCVEVWFCLHFRNLEEPVTRDELFRWMALHLGRLYDKADAGLFDDLQPHMEIAHQRAAALVGKHSNQPGGLNPGQHNPLTRLHELMRSLARNE